MTKKKPDFLRDLDTAIMDELTGGGIKGNAAGLVGTLTQIKEIKQLCGLPFCGYMAKLETVRPSGVPDEVTVVFAEDVPYRACNGIEFDVMQEFVEGSRLLLTGKAQTYLGLDTVGVAEFFALLYIAYEVVSIFKNMALCGLPVKKVWEKVREFLAKYTDELPDTDELDGDSTTGNVEEHRTQER